MEAIGRTSSTDELSAQSIQSDISVGGKEYVVSQDVVR